MIKNEWMQNITRNDRTLKIYSLAPGRYVNNLRSVIFTYVLWINKLSTSSQVNALDHFELELELIYFT